MSDIWYKYKDFIILFIILILNIGLLIDFSLNLKFGIDDNILGLEQDKQENLWYNVNNMTTNFFYAITINSLFGIYYFAKYKLVLRYKIEQTNIKDIDNKV